MAATAAAVASLLHVHPPPAIAASDERTLGGATLVTVVLDLSDGAAQVAGSAVVTSGQLLAYAQAVWSALRPIS